MRTNNNFIAGSHNDSYVHKRGSLPYVCSGKMIISFGFLILISEAVHKEKTRTDDQTNLLSVRLTYESGRDGK